MRSNCSLHTTPTVINEITSGSAIGTAAAARQFPAYRGDRSSLDPSTLWRWMARGVRLPDGQILRLEAARVGGRVLTSEQAVRRFIEAQAVPSSDPAPAPRTTHQRARAAERAAAELAKLGV